MDMDDTSQLAHERHLATTEERKVLALEMIADHLQKIGRAFVDTGDLRGGDTTFERTAATKGDVGVADEWDNEEGYSEPDSHEALGVKRTLVEHFAVGGYAYTNLAHAIAQAKRDRLLGERP